MQNKHEKPTELKLPRRGLEISEDMVLEALSGTTASTEDLNPCFRGPTTQRCDRDLNPCGLITIIGLWWGIILPNRLEIMILYDIMMIQYNPLLNWFGLPQNERSFHDENHVFTNEKSWGFHRMSLCPHCLGSCQTKKNARQTSR